MAKYSDAQRQEWKDKMQGLIKQVSNLSAADKEKLAETNPITTCEGHAISPYNHCFLAMQTDKPLTVIGGFRQWQRAGRMVSKGNKAAGYIYVPMKGKTDDPDKKLRFRMVPVFDISQTEEIQEGVAA